MLILFVILIVLASVILGLIVLIQNPKGGGLAGNIAGFSSQFMGVKQTTDVLEKGTWIFASIVGILCLFSSFFIKSGKSSDSFTPDASGIKTNTQQAAPLQAQPGQPGNTVPLNPTKPDSVK